jgi:acyl-CoA reductase-like NAD-dependent aldehyde dehydrogenase
MARGLRSEREIRQSWREKTPEERKDAIRALEAAFEAQDDEYAERILHGGPWDEDDAYYAVNGATTAAMDEVPWHRRVGPNFRRGHDRDNWPPR